MHFGKVERAVAASLLVALLGAAAATASQSSRAAFPGLNGRIVFNDQSGSLMLVNPNGSGVVRVAQTHASDYTIGASFSRDGAQIAYSTNRTGDADVFVIRPDGSGQRQVTFSRGNDLDPAFSRDGSRLAFESDRTGTVDVYSVAANGTGSRRLTSEATNERDPAWSPTADRIANTVESGASRQIWVMNGDGSGKQQLTDAPNLNENPNWSPDGRRIVFDSDRAEAGDLEIYSMAVDGTVADEDELLPVG